jgi:uncharacterized repeat protein (TIGR01451 family)
METSQRGRLSEHVALLPDPRVDRPKRHLLRESAVSAGLPIEDLHWTIAVNTTPGAGTFLLDRFTHGAAPDPGDVGYGAFGTALVHDGAQLFVGAQAARVDGQALAGALYVWEPTTDAPVDLVVTSDVVPPATPTGDEATYIIEVRNASANPATDVRLHNPVQFGTSFVSASDGCCFDAGLVTCELGTLGPDDEAQVSLTLRVTQGGTSQPRNTNFATATSREPDVNWVDNTSAKAVEVLPAVEPDPEPVPPQRSGGGTLGIGGAALLAIWPFGARRRGGRSV